MPWRLPFRVDRDAQNVVFEPIPMRLTAVPSAPALRAVRAAAHAVTTCAVSARPQGAAVLDARLLVGEAGELARIELTSSSPTGEAITRCVAGTALPPVHGRLARVELRLSVARDGGVTVAR